MVAYCGQHGGDWCSLEITTAAGLRSGLAARTVVDVGAGEFAPELGVAAVSSYSGIGRRYSRIILFGGACKRPTVSVIRPRRSAKGKHDGDQSGKYYGKYTS